jgi:glucose/arabinose dehydrogenase
MAASLADRPREEHICSKTMEARMKCLPGTIAARLATTVAAALFTGLAGGPGPADALEAVSLGAFVNPVHVAAAPGFPRLLFVVERPGRIRVLQDEQKLATAFLDIREIVLGLPDENAGGEQGLLSIAFPPDYGASRRFYVFFTNRDGDLEIAEFRRTASDPTRASPATRRRLLLIPHREAKNHNGGQLQFGPDGLLYISTGDGGSIAPRGKYARSLNSLLGKILRIDPQPSESLPYTIPPDNPYVGRPGRNQIFAYGLRNPWRFTFDRTRLAIGDVGQALREEVNMLPLDDARGANFGWPQYEGDVFFDPDRPGPDAPTFPIFTYSHDEGGCAVIGGYFVRGPRLPELNGRYLYGDTCTGELRSFIPRVGTQEALDDRPTGVVLRGLTSFGRGVGGRIYVTQTSGAGGALWRLDP